MRDPSHISKEASQFEQSHSLPAEPLQQLIACGDKSLAMSRKRSLRRSCPLASPQHIEIAAPKPATVLLRVLASSDTRRLLQKPMRTADSSFGLAELPTSPPDRCLRHGGRCSSKIRAGIRVAQALGTGYRWPHCLEDISILGMPEDWTAGQMGISQVFHDSPAARHKCLCQDCRSCFVGATVRQALQDILTSRIWMMRCWSG